MASKKHNCPWRDKAEKLEAQLETLASRMNEVEHKLALATKQIVGPKRERMPTPDEEAKAGRKPARGGYTVTRHAPRRGSRATPLASGLR